MKNKIAYIENGDKKYPLVFNLNVMEEIQEKYGSIEEWGKITQGIDGNKKDTEKKDSKKDTEKKDSKKEPAIKDLKFGFAAMINEGIEIENEENNTERPLLTLKQVGRLISDVGMKEVAQRIRDITVASVKTEGDGKNE